MESKTCGFFCFKAVSISRRNGFALPCFDGILKAHMFGICEIFRKCDNRTPISFKKSGFRAAFQARNQNCIGHCTFDTDFSVDRQTYHFLR